MNFECTKVMIGFGPGAVPPVSTETRDVVCVNYADLLRGDVDVGACAVVITPLFGTDFDAIDLLERLSETAFCGNVRVEAPKLPNKRIVLRELRSIGDRCGISVELVELGQA